MNGNEHRLHFGIRTAAEESPLHKTMAYNLLFIIIVVMRFRDVTRRDPKAKIKFSSLQND